MAPLVKPPPVKTTQKWRFSFAYVSQYDTKHSQNNNYMYTNSTIPFPLLFKNAIRNSLSQKLLPKNWFWNGKLEKNGAFFWRQPFSRKAQAKKKKKRNCQRCARTSSIKKTQLEVFYKKKINQKVVRGKHFFREKIPLNRPTSPLSSIP